MTPEEKTNQPQPESQDSENKKEGGDVLREPVNPEISKDQPEESPETKESPETADKPENTTEIKETESPKAETKPTDQLVKVRVTPEGDKVVDRDDLPPEGEYGAKEYEDFSALYEKTLTEIKEGEIVTGRIVAISDKDIAVDIGFKSEGTVPIEEFTDPAELKIGNDIEVFLDRVENQEGQLILSKKKAEFMKVWARIKEVHENNETIEGKIIRRIKGGMVVDLMGVDGFLPGSQIDVHPVRDFDALVSKVMDFRIVKINDTRKNIVLSHKVLVEESLAEIREKILGEMKVGNVLDGVVKNITDFGVFVDLGGVDGLLHITDLSWGRVTHPSEIVSLDQKIRVKVLDYDEERQRISLGLKQLMPHPWEGVEERYPVGSRVTGKVVSIARYGAFVELEKGVEGLVHISEMSWTQNIKHPSMLVSVGSEVEVVVLGVDVENRKISLGMKQCKSNPWDEFAATHKKGDKVSGTIKSITDFGIFIGLDGGIDGLVHMSDISWNLPDEEAVRAYKKGDELETVILAIDPERERISLGIKQLEQDPFGNYLAEHPKGSIVKGTITEVDAKGALVQLAEGIEGYIRASEIARDRVEDARSFLKEGEEVDAKFIGVDRKNRTLNLSIKAKDNAEEAEAIQDYSRSQGDMGSTTLGDLLKEQMESNKS